MTESFYLKNINSNDELNISNNYLKNHINQIKDHIKNKYPNFFISDIQDTTNGKYFIMYRINNIQANEIEKELIDMFDVHITKDYVPLTGRTLVNLNIHLKKPIIKKVLSWKQLIFIFILFFLGLYCIYKQDFDDFPWIK
jgi:hypothetical protein